MAFINIFRTLKFRYNQGLFALIINSYYRITHVQVQQMARLQFSRHQRATDSVNADCKLVSNSQLKCLRRLQQDCVGVSLYQ